MKIAVTGGAGYIGSTLVKMLADKGHGVVSVDNLSLGDYSYLRSQGLGGRAEFVEGDIRDIELLKRSFRGADAVAHLAAIPGLVLCAERPEEAVSVNIYGTQTVLEAASRLGIRRVVFCSSAAVYGTPVKLPVTEEHRLRPLNLYGVTKLAGEKIMDTYFDSCGMETVNLRFGNVFGVGLYTRWSTVIPKFVRQGMEGQPLTIYGDGNSSRDFVHVEDICQALTLALTKEGVGGEAYNVGGEAISIGSLSKIVSTEVEKATGRRVGVTHMPPRPGETREFSYNLRKIEECLGYRPGWDIEKGVIQLITYYRSQRPD